MFRALVRAQTVKIKGKKVVQSIDDSAVIAKGEFERAAKERKVLKKNMEEIKMNFAYTDWQIDNKIAE